MQIGWIDFSKEDREKVKAALEALKDKRALDELGIGVVRDGFADYFFPGTSTIQTRAKYFLLLPYIMNDLRKEIETELKKVYARHDKKSMKAFRDKLYDRQKEATQLLVDGSEKGTTGIIGQSLLEREEGWVVQTPMAIYWGGITRLGIYKHQESVDQFFNRCFRRAENNKQITGSHKEKITDDDDELDDEDAGKDNDSLWKISIPENWKENLSIQLTHEEAAELKKAMLDYRVPQSNAESLMAFILRNNIDVSRFGGEDGFEGLYEHLTRDAVIKDKLPDDLKEVMKLACGVRNLVYVAYLRFNIQLRQGKDNALEKEWQQVINKLDELCSVDLDQVRDVLNPASLDWYMFLKNFQMKILSGDIVAADAVVKRREVNLKKSRSKFSQIGKVQFTGWVGTRKMNYRLDSITGMIEEIRTGADNYAKAG